MKLIQGGKKDPAINEQDWKFIKTSLRQCIATKFITDQLRVFLSGTDSIPKSLDGQF